jgi:hypothetical protein
MRPQHRLGVVVQDIMPKMFQWLKIRRGMYEDQFCEQIARGMYEDLKRKDVIAILRPDAGQMEVVSKIQMRLHLRDYMAPMTEATGKTYTWARDLANPE